MKLPGQGSHSFLLGQTPQRGPSWEKPPHPVMTKKTLRGNLSLPLPLAEQGRGGRPLIDRHGTVTGYHGYLLYYISLGHPHKPLGGR